MATLSPSTGAPPPAFAIGTGRCGTHFIARALGREPAVAAHHERHPLGDSFQRWCAWNRLAVDPAGFLATKQAGIREDREAGRISFEASAYLSLAAPLLHEAFGARFVLFVRRPDRVVASYFEKGWYEDGPLRGDPRLPAGYQPGPRQPHQPFSRLAGFGEDGERWARLSRVGKLAYFWRHLNEAVLRDFARLPSEATRVLQLEAFDFAQYREVAHLFGFTPELGRDAFERLAQERPGKRAELPGVASWSGAEVAEFESEVAPLAERLGMEWRCERLRSEAAPAPTRRTFGARLVAALGHGR
jgi:hypothetical protein